MELNIVDPVESLIRHDGAIAVVIRHWLPETAATNLHDTLTTHLPWEQRLTYGAPVPRLICAVGNGNLSEYKYNRMALPMNSWDTENEVFAAVRNLRDRIADDSRIIEIVQEELHYDSCLLNHYRNGRDSIDFHSDREALGPLNAVVALSLGATRTFHFKHKVKGPNEEFPHYSPNQYPRIKVPIHNGDLMIMAGRCQELWTHGVPKEECEGSRISATFRLIGH